MALVSVSGQPSALRIGDFTVPDVPVEDCCGGSARMPGGGDIDFEGGATPYRFGAVTKEATGVELQPSDGSDPVPGTLVPLPPSLMNFPFDLFFLDAGALNGKIVATGLATPTPSDHAGRSHDHPEPVTRRRRPPRARLLSPVCPRSTAKGWACIGRASSKVEAGKACIYVTIDDILESDGRVRRLVRTGPRDPRGGRRDLPVRCAAPSLGRRVGDRRAGWRRAASCSRRAGRKGKASPSSSPISANAIGSDPGQLDRAIPRGRRFGRLSRMANRPAELAFHPRHVTATSAMDRARCASSPWRHG